MTNPVPQLRLLFTALLIGLLCSAAQATWYSENVDNGADLIMMDLRWPWWPSGTYFANWNTSFNPKPNSISFYAGFVSYVPDGPGQTPHPDAVRQDAFRPGSVWTFWGSDATGTPVRFTDVAPNLFIKNDYGGEGSSGTTGAEVWPFVQRGRWYTMLARVWQPADGGGHAFVGRWIKDHADGQWHLIGVARLPIAATSFAGNSGFLEPLTSEKAVRSLHRRYGYFRKDGQWRKSDTIAIDKTQYVIVNTVPEGDHEYAAIEYAQRPDLLPRQLSGQPLAGDQRHSFTVRQPDLPVLDQPAVTNVRAVALGGQIAVSWEVSPTASPAFSCQVEVFDNPRCEGQPIAVREERLPTLRDMLVAAPASPAAVRLTVTDIFDQAAPPVIVSPALVPAIAPPGVTAPTTAGLAYELYHKDSKRPENYFNPPLQAPDEQHHWLRLEEIPQGQRVRRGLARGFDTGVREHREDGYALSFQGLLRVPADGPYIFRAQIDGGYRFQLDGADVLVWDGQHGTTEKAAVAVLAKGDHPLAMTLVYDALPAKNFRLDWEYRGPLPAGANSLWARIVFDGDRTVESAPRTLHVRGRPVSDDWTVRNVGDAKASAGLWQTGAGSFQFFGNGMHTVTRRISGDFTASCRIVGYNGSQGEPVNRRAWVGLTAREYGERLNWEWGRDFHLVQTAADGLRASADFTDFGAGRVTSYELPRDRPWLRIMRQGDIWTAWTSLDGQQWELGAYQFKRTQPEMDVGLFFSALPQDARAHYQASVADVAIHSGVAADSRVPAPVAAANVGGDRLTGVVLARSDARVMVVRSSAAGLLRSLDGGQSWSAANGSLTGDDLVVRSVAIHPEDPGIMLRACGRGMHGRLWRTSDGGQTWTQLPLEGDFDGAGPSALCGEVLAFDLRDPRTLYAGCESQGFFRSTDSGATWVRLGAVGERVTAVVVWPWEKHYPAPARGRTQLCVITCPDRWMELLGRGRPAVETPATTSRAYLSDDGVKTIAVSDERSDTGFFNVAFDKAMQSVNEMRYATAHGFQTQVFAGWHMALYPPQKHLEWFRPFTAVAATALGDDKFGRFIAQALDPVQPGRYSVSERWAFEWSWLTPQGVVPAGGLIAAAGDVQLGQAWCFLHADGLYLSADGVRTLTRALDAAGHHVRGSRP